MRLSNSQIAELKELFYTKKITSGEKLNNELSFTEPKFILNYQTPPTYNFLRLNKKTVFCHLNPGGNPSIKVFQEKLNQFSNSDEFITDYINQKKNYPKNRFLINGKFDPFDYKQALFLSGFPNTGIDFKSISSDKLESDRVKRSYDCFSVLENKTQLELLPFESKSFKNLFHSYKSSKIVFPYISKYLMDLLDIIISYKREYVIFGSDQYSNLLQAANDSLIEFQIIRMSKKIPLEIGTKNKAYVSICEIKWKNVFFIATIAHSFPRQDLPNAHDKMHLYGKLSYIEFMKFKNELPSTAAKPH